MLFLWMGSTRMSGGTKEVALNLDIPKITNQGIVHGTKRSLLEAVTRCYGRTTCFEESKWGWPFYKHRVTLRSLDWIKLRE